MAFEFNFLAILFTSTSYWWTPAYQASSKVSFKASHNHLLCPCVHSCTLPHGSCEASLHTLILISNKTTFLCHWPKIFFIMFGNVVRDPSRTLLVIAVCRNPLHYMFEKTCLARNAIKRGLILTVGDMNDYLLLWILIGFCLFIASIVSVTGWGPEGLESPTGGVAKGSATAWADIDLDSSYWRILIVFFTSSTTLSSSLSSDSPKQELQSSFASLSSACMSRRWLRCR